MTGDLLEKGERDREHKDTGRQRSGPEEGKHARQPERRAGSRRDCFVNDTECVVQRKPRQRVTLIGKLFTIRAGGLSPPAKGRWW